MPSTVHRILSLLMLLIFMGTGAVYAQSSSCISPLDFRQASFLENEAGLVWLGTGSTSEWEVAWGPQGTSVQSMSNRVNVTQTWVILPGITPNSSSVAYVRSVCGSSHSNWVGPISIGGLPSCGAGHRLPAEFEVVCGPQSAHLQTPNGSEAIWWYGGVPLHYGPDYYTDTLFNDRTYWVTPATQNGVPQIVGPSIQSQIGGFANFNSGLAIEVMDTLVLDSVTLMADAAVNFQIQVWNLYGTQLVAESVELSFDQAGEERFELDLPLLPGQYRVKLDIQPGGGRLFRSINDQNYPYVLPGLISIDSTTNGLNNRYYYLYDLAVSYICQSQPSSYHVEVGSQGVAGTNSSDTLCVMDSLYNLSEILLSAQMSQNGYWKDLSTGDSILSLDGKLYLPGQRLELHYIAPGSHGCSDTSYHHIYFKDCGIGWNEYAGDDLVLYPNPAQAEFRIDAESTEIESITLLTLEGRVVSEFDEINQAHDISNLPSGVYFVKVSSDTFTRVFKLKKL